MRHALEERFCMDYASGACPIVEPPLTFWANL